MKQLIFTQLFLISIICFGNGRHQSFNGAYLSDAPSQISKAKFRSFFTDLDTIKAIQQTALRKAASCSWGTYKYISNKYIIRINTELFSKRYDNFYEVNISSKENNNFLELLEYDKADATLENICTDMKDWNSPHPTRNIKPMSGKVVIGFTKPNNSYDQFNITVLIKNINFVDTKTKQVISFKNELIWKVVYDGIPG